MFVFFSLFHRRDISSVKVFFDGIIPILKVVKKTGKKKK